MSINKTPLYIREISEELKEDFKILCFSQRLSMQEGIVKLIADLVKKNKDRIDRIKKDMK